MQGRTQMDKGEACQSIDRLTNAYGGGLVPIIEKIGCGAVVSGHAVFATMTAYPYRQFRFYDPDRVTAFIAENPELPDPRKREE